MTKPYDDKQPSAYFYVHDENNAPPASTPTEREVASSGDQTRRYALLQAAATIYAGLDHSQSYRLSSSPTNESKAVNAAEALLAEIERRENA